MTKVQIHLKVCPSNASAQLFRQPDFQWQHDSPVSLVTQDDSWKCFTIQSIVVLVTCNNSMASNNKVSLPLYGRYLVTDLDCDGNHQAV